MTSLLCVIEMETFLRAAERLMSEEERAKIVDIVAADPAGGVVIPGTGGLRKLRIALKGRGKRGGGRVVYWYHSEGNPAALLTVFAKGDASDLTAQQRRSFIAIGAAILEQLGARR
jgi:hypothetical protein